MFWLLRGMCTAASCKPGAELPRKDTTPHCSLHTLRHKPTLHAAHATQRVRTDAEGNAVPWAAASLGGGMPFDMIYGPQGWCQADEPIVRCDCVVDGYAGLTCEARTEAFCPNQCRCVQGRGGLRHLRMCCCRCRPCCAVFAVPCL